MLGVFSEEECSKLLSSLRWQRIYNAGARPQRLLWASTGTKDPSASDVLYVKALAAPFTVNTMPEGTLKAFADHGDSSETVLADDGNSETVLHQLAAAGVDVYDLATRLRDEGAKSRQFVERAHGCHRFKKLHPREGQLNTRGEAKTSSDSHNDVKIMKSEKRLEAEIRNKSE